MDHGTVVITSCFVIGHGFGVCQGKNYWPGILIALLGCLFYCLCGRIYHGNLSTRFGKIYWISYGSHPIPGCEMNRLNKYILAAFTILVLFIPWVCQGREIIIFGNHAKPPKVWLEKGEPSGFLVEMLTYLEPELGVQFKFFLSPWKRAYGNMIAGEGGLIGLSKNNERLKVIDYSAPMFIDEIIIVVIKGREFSYQGLGDLKGKTLGLQSGASYGTEFEAAKNHIFTPEYDHGSVSRLLKLLSNRMDAALINPGRPALEKFLKAHPLLLENKDQFVVLDLPLKRDPNYLGFAKTANEKEFLSRFNSAMEKARQSGAFDEIISRHMK